MKRIKRLKAAALLVMAVLLFTACGSVQVNERMFVQLMGIREDNGITELAVQVFDSSSADADNPVPVYKVLRGRGRSFYEAADMIMRDSGRELFFGHCSAIFADEDIIRDSEKLRLLSGERISPGCPVLLSDSPEEDVSAEDENGQLIGADRIFSVISLYRKEGLADKSDLKTVTEAADSGGFAIVPVYDGDISGCAVINMSGGTSRLSITETAAFDLLRGCKGIRLGVLDGSVTAGKAEKSVYYRSLENGGEYTVSLSLKCRRDEGSGPADVYREETERIISLSAEEICRRAAAEGFLSELIPQYHGDEDNLTFKASAEIIMK